MRLTVYGIPNCDTVKKARVWLMVTRWLAAQPMDKLLNKRGTSWRKLSDADKANAYDAHLIALMLANPTLIKRPVIEAGDKVTVGFTDEVKAAWA